MSTERKKWEMMDGESVKAFEAFQLYLESDSIRAAYRQQTGNEQATQVSGEWNGWTGQFDWVERKRAWVDHLATIQRVEIENAMRQAAVLSANYLLDVLKTNITHVAEFNGYGLSPKDFKDMPDHAKNALKDIQHKTGELTKISLPDRLLAARDVLKGLEHLGSSNKVELTGKNGGPIETKGDSPLSQLPPEKLARIMAIMNEPDKKPLEEDE